ncbi:biopolymer transporter ExbD [Asticcacaulis sp. ZE23SCel15]|jgi:biopolymer transport protein ExbD|uniref:ExbD/TolR family protein n=1 Tax=Asticcacaulis sp. ZE23SCel15 TaxID=3059027 RepID=UPI00265D8D1F|nr:biopolymer transporter ExbD [Asticcacaulis sp. ZE23SCel15]WKL58540.1 biopolymer transporter ExbD [Asticcacaulis sp. ZE23SCel15]
MGAKLGGGGGSRYTVQQNSDINVTPFVDIMLVLLIIFMVSAPMATVSIKLDLPPASAPVTQEKQKDPVFVSIQDKDLYYIGTKQVTIDIMAAELAAALQSANPTDERVLVRAQPDVEYEEFMKVLNELQENGYFKIGLINEDIS